MKRIIVTLAGVLLGLAAATSQASDLAAGKAVFDKHGCANCHGADGKSPTDPQYPILAGQHDDYLAHALQAYRRGQSGEAPSANIRKNPVMGAFAVQLNDVDIDNVAAWLSSLPSDLGTRK
jgi:cytochrome c553